MSEQPQDETMDQALRQRLQTLPAALTPAHDQWPHIASRLRSSPESRTHDRASGGWRWTQALAAVLVLSVVAAVVWQQLPETVPSFNDHQVSIGAPSDPLPQAMLARELEQAAQAILQGMHKESAASLVRLSASEATTDLQAGLQEYQLAEQQLQQALAQQPHNQSLWQQLSGLQVSRLNMLGVHAR